MVRAAVAPEREVETDGLFNEELRDQRRLVFALQATCRGMAGVILKQTHLQSKSLMTWRRLQLEKERKIVGRFETMLMSLFIPSQF